jgi:hypothetical protein
MSLAQEPQNNKKKHQCNALFKKILQLSLFEASLILFSFYSYA